MSRRARMLAATVAGSALVVAAGCGGGGGTLDASQVEAKVKSTLQKQAGLGPSEFKSIKCPDDVKQEAGLTFHCTVTYVDDSTGPIDVTQINDDGGIDVQMGTPANIEQAEKKEQTK